MKRLVSVLFVLFLVVPTLRASAQTPTVITANVHAQFTASTDHNTVLLGVPFVSRYDLLVITMTQPQPPSGPLVAGALALTVGLGKPTPDASNKIDVPVPTLYSTLANGIYVATVAAVGPGGAAAASAASDPFLRLGAPAGVTAKPAIVAQ